MPRLRSGHRWLALCATSGTWNYRSSFHTFLEHHSTSLGHELCDSDDTEIFREVSRVNSALQDLTAFMIKGVGPHFQSLRTSRDGSPSDACLLNLFRHEHVGHANFVAYPTTEATTRHRMPAMRPFYLHTVYISILQIGHGTTTAFPIPQPASKHSPFPALHSISVHSWEFYGENKLHQDLVFCFHMSFLFWFSFRKVLKAARIGLLLLI